MNNIPNGGNPIENILGEICVVKRLLGVGEGEWKKKKKELKRIKNEKKKIK